MKQKIGLILGLIMLMGVLLNTYDGVLSALPLSINPVVSATHTATAFTPVVRNEDWTPVEREFDGVMMVLVPAGSFVMGSTQAEIDAAFVQCEESLGVWNCQREWVEREARNGDNIQTFTEPFWIDKYEVSQEQFAQFDGQKADPFEFTGDDNFPIGLITWVEAQAYCEARDGRLPTEREWEYASRGPDGLIYTWGNEFDASRVRFCEDCSQIFLTIDMPSDYINVAPVDSYSDGASWVGAYQMSGNTWEWMLNIYHEYPYSASSEDMSDYIEGNINNDSPYRALRGGSWRSPPYLMRSATRGGSPPAYGMRHIGFRCMRPYSDG